ncbi:MAG: hypothetical protein JWM90_166 [Thermoleophilia bacterium]|nr:hypothetical protein [Thermoleophilia bacterium]
MDRKHLILPATLLAGSALLGGRALLDSLPTGPEPSESVASLVETTTTTGTVEDEVRTRTAQLDADERAIDAAARQKPPAVAPLQTNGVSGTSGPGGGGTSGGNSGPGNGTVTAPRAADGHGGSGRDHAEDGPHRGGVDDDRDEDSFDDVDDVDDDSRGENRGPGGGGGDDD